jgi:hypothetical protein
MRHLSLAHPLRYVDSRAMADLENPIKVRKREHRKRQAGDWRIGVRWRRGDLLTRAVGILIVKIGELPSLSPDFDIYCGFKTRKVCMI